MFEHSHLPNLGLTMGMIPPEIYQDLHKEIMDISNDDSNISKVNETLAGFLTKEYEITKTRQLLDPFLEEMAKEYQKKWDYFPFGNDDMKVDAVWVNMQQKSEVNPLHNHKGELSFVAWLHVPFKLEDERNMENCKNSRTVELTSTFQFVYNTVLGKIVNTPLFVESGWEGKIVMFPSQLLHIVYPFQTSDDYRISIAGNLY